MARKHETPITARGYELDSYNHVNNAVYLNYFEHARWEYFRASGLTEIMQATVNLPVVTEINIRYQREIRLFDDLVVESVCEEVKPYLVFRQRLINRTTGLNAARCVTKLIFTDANRMPCEVPAEILSAI
jgi:acyl-CoA thioester hydrolase